MVSNRKMMASTLALIATLFATGSAIELNQEAAALVEQPAAADLMMAAQSEACDDEDDIDVNDDEDYGVEHSRRYCPYGSKPYPCYCKPCCQRKKDYKCPPLVNDCPGVIQPAGPCMDAVCERPLHYDNCGHVCTHWKHDMNVSGEPCCACTQCPGHPRPPYKHCKCHKYGV